MSDQPNSGERATVFGALLRRSVLLRNTGKVVAVIAVVGAAMLMIANHTRQAEKPEEMPTNQASFGKIQPYELPKPLTPVGFVQPIKPPEAKPVTELTTAKVPTSSPAMASFAVAPLPDVWKPKTVAAPGTKQDDGKTHMAYVGKAIAGGRAGPMGDTSLVLMPGLVRCSMDTAINSDLAGPFICHLPGPILSDVGAVLMEQGSTIVGTYDSKIVQGQKRLPTIAATGYTPNGCAVPFGTPMADGLGRTGLEGEVDNHIWSRFGGAVLVSLIDSALGVLQSSLSKSGSTYLSFSGGAGSLAQDILRETINQKPTITVNQGSDVALWVTAPVDFNDCYKLEAKR